MPEGDGAKGGATQSPTLTVKIRAASHRAPRHPGNFSSIQSGLNAGGQPARKSPAMKISTNHDMPIVRASARAKGPCFAKKLILLLRKFQDARPVQCGHPASSSSCAHMPLNQSSTSFFT